MISVTSFSHVKKPKIMFAKEILFWNVDTQIDFMHSDGKLYVRDAETIQNKLAELTKIAEEKKIQVVNTCDYHFSNSAELSGEPNFITTFPEHCMADSDGCEFITETKPGKAYTIDWNKKYSVCEIEYALENRNIIIRKDAFDVFEGNQNTEEIVKRINPKKIIVYGVTTNVCVNCAVIGLAKRDFEVIVISDAIKELPNLPLPFSEWEQLGIQQISLSELKDRFSSIWK